MSIEKLQQDLMPDESPLVKDSSVAQIILRLFFSQASKGLLRFAQQQDEFTAKKNRSIGLPERLEIMETRLKEYEEILSEEGVENALQTLKLPYSQAKERIVFLSDIYLLDFLNKDITYKVKLAQKFLVQFWKSHETTFENSSLKDIQINFHKASRNWQFRWIFNLLLSKSTRDEFAENLERRFYELAYDYTHNQVKQEYLNIKRLINEEKNKEIQQLSHKTTEIVKRQKELATEKQQAIAFYYLLNELTDNLNLTDMARFALFLVKEDWKPEDSNKNMSGVNMYKYMNTISKLKKTDVTENMSNDLKIVAKQFEKIGRIDIVDKIRPFIIEKDND